MQKSAPSVPMAHALWGPRDTVLNAPSALT